MKALRDAVKKGLPEYLNFWKAICNMETPSSDRAALNLQCDFIEHFAQQRGFITSRQSYPAAGDTLVVERKGAPSLAPVALLAHMDTVHPGGAFGYPVVKEKNGVLYGPGVFDCKGGIAVALLAMECMAAVCTEHRTIRLILNSDEEDGTFISDAGVQFIQNAARGCCAAFNVEAGRDDSLTIGRKGIIRAEIIVAGVAGHAGNAYFESASAIREAAYKVIMLEDKSERDGITYNCGRICGGNVANIVPDHCTIKVDVRYKNLKQQERALEVLRYVTKQNHVNGCKAELKIIHIRPAMECTEGNLVLYSKVMAAAKELGMKELLPMERGGGSDSAYTVAMGIPTVCSMGTVGRYEHTVLEEADIDTLESRALLLAKSILKV